MTNRIIRGKEPAAKAKLLDARRTSAPKQQAAMKAREVDAKLARLRHPFTNEIQALRAIIKGVHPGITEQWKWNAPSYSYKDYLVTFNLRAKDRVHLVFHNGAILDPQGGFLQGDYPDRRMAYFADMEEVRAKKEILERVIQEWVKEMDK